MFCCLKTSHGLSFHSKKGQFVKENNLKLFIHIVFSAALYYFFSKHLFLLLSNCIPLLDIYFDKILLTIFGAAFHRDNWMAKTHIIKIFYFFNMEALQEAILSQPNCTFQWKYPISHLSAIYKVFVQLICWKEKKTVLIRSVEVSLTLALFLIFLLPAPFFCSYWEVVSKSLRISVYHVSSIYFSFSLLHIYFSFFSNVLVQG